MKFLKEENYSYETLFLCCICFIAGLTAGFLISPAKNGMIIGSYNGCNNKVVDSNKTKKITDSKITGQ